MRIHWTPTTRLSRLLLITIAGLFASLLLTTDAWMSSVRSYPFSPIIDGFALSPTVTTLAFAAVFVAFGGALVMSKARGGLLVIGLAALLLLVLADITRLQPWVFHYATILAFIAYGILRQRSASDVLDAAALMIAGIYFWSGVQKMNLIFVAGVFPWFTEPLWSPFGEMGLRAALVFGLFVPFLEAAFGLGFLTKRARHLSLLAASAMLVIVLASIGPFGHDWNSSVWPWNIAIFATAFALFFRSELTLRQLLVRSKRNLLAWTAVGLFWVMPVGSYFGVVDHYLAWSLYSGTVPEATLTGDHATLESLSTEAEAGTLAYVEWVHEELNVVPYPEVRVFVDVFDRICERYPEDELSLTITQYKKDARSFECQ